jgi:hypothetical protein
VGQVFQDTQALADNFVAFATLDVGDKPDATGIVFIGRIIQALFWRQRASLHWKYL